MLENKADSPLQPTLFYDTMISVPDTTTCVTSIYWRQRYALTDRCSAPALLKMLFLLTVQSQIGFWGEGGVYTQIMNSASVLHSVKTGFYIKYKEDELYVQRKSLWTKIGPPHSSFSDLSHSSSDPNPASLGLMLS